MAQGAIKKASKAPGKKTPSQARLQRGSRVIKPKKTNLLRAQKIAKKHSGSLVTQTEKTLGEKAGHLELLKGGKKEKKAANAKGK